MNLHRISDLIFKNCIFSMPHFLHTLLLYELNGFLALTYVLWEHLAGILVLASFSFFVLHAPAGQRAWTVARARWL